MRLPLPPFVSLSCALVSAAGVGAQDAMPNFGHARTRELAELGRLPSVRDVVVRDIVNYHRHRLPLPAAGAAVQLDVRFDRRGAAPGDDVWLQVGYTTAPQGDRSLAEPCAVALVVDCSGSMSDAGKMTAVQAGLRAFVERLRPDDEIALVTFADDARVAAGLRTRGDGRWLRDAIDELSPNGSTNLHAGLMAGLDELARVDSRGRSRRVVLLTDGIANRGVTEPARIADDAARRAETAVDIATIGVGENLDVPLLQRLAEGTRGLFHFVGDARDVEKVFVQEADALVTPVARRPRLTVDVPEGLEVVEVFGEGVRRSRAGLDVDLPDLNAGVTAVVMARCRVVGADATDVRAEMRFHDARTADVEVVRASAQLDGARGTYTVRVGDTLERIAKEQLGDERRADEVLRHNPGADPRRLRVGQRLQLARPEIDVEVRKNAAIATLARGLADMAAACDTRRWADADRALRLATDDAQRLFPGADEDVQRVRDIAAGHARTLQRYVDRFRDY